MQSIGRSLLVPALLSITSLAVTFWWFDKLEREAARGNTDATPIAYLKAARDPIERRTKSRVLWQNLEEGGPLYAGDAIRTPPKTEGSVQLVQDDTIVTLEADSLIVLEDTKGRLELNLVSGALLVEKRVDTSGRPASKDAKGPVIKSGSTRLELGSGAQVSLAKTKGAEASIAVAKGQVEVAGTTDKKLVVNAGQVSTVGSDGGVKAVTGIEPTQPSPNAVIVLERPEARGITFAWKPIEGPGTVRVEIGPQRAEVKDAGLQTAANAGSMRVDAPAGTFYWRLVLRSPDGKVVATSPVLRADTLVPTPASLYAPDNAASMVLAEGGVTVPFTWSRPPRSRDVTLEIARDAAFSKGVTSVVAGEEQQKSMVLKGEGTYFWRVSAKVDGVNRPVVSEVRRFAVQKPQDLPTPDLLRPAANAAVDEGAVKASGIFLEWEKVPTAARYRVQVTAGGKVKVDETVAAAGHKLDSLPAGVYEWRVQSLAEDGRASKWSAARPFAVKRMPELRWLVTSGSTQEYADEKPQAKLSWDDGPDGATSYRFRSAASRGGLDSAAWFKTAKSEVVIRHEAEGTYFYEAQALGAGGATVAASKPISITIKPSPDVDPPTLLTASKGDLKAQANGSLAIKWSAVKGAQAYRIELRHTSSGKTTDLRSEGTRYDLSGLLPGRYELRLRSEGRTAKVGKFGRARVVVVPAVSDVAPPDTFDVKVH